MCETWYTVPESETSWQILELQIACTLNRAILKNELGWLQKLMDR